MLLAAAALRSDAISETPSRVSEIPSRISERPPRISEITSRISEMPDLRCPELSAGSSLVSCSLVHASPESSPSLKSSDKSKSRPSQSKSGLQRPSPATGQVATSPPGSWVHVSTRGRRLWGYTCTKYVVHGRGPRGVYAAGPPGRGPSSSNRRATTRARGGAEPADSRQSRATRRVLSNDKSILRIGPRKRHRMCAHIKGAGTRPQDRQLRFRICVSQSAFRDSRDLYLVSWIRAVSVTCVV